MPFASINPTIPRTNLWNFGENCSAFGDVKKLSFFESAILIFFFCFIPMKISHKLCVRMDGTQFLILWCFTAKDKGGNHKIAWVYIASFIWCGIFFQNGMFRNDVALLGKVFNIEFCVAWWKLFPFPFCLQILL